MKKDSYIRFSCTLIQTRKELKYKNDLHIYKFLSPWLREKKRLKQAQVKDQMDNASTRKSFGSNKVSIFSLAVSMNSGKSNKPTLRISKIEAMEARERSRCFILG
jgi:hypothetical protein